MKKYFFPLILIVCFLVTFLSCSNKSKRSRKPVSTISIIPNKTNYTIADSITIQIKTKLKNGELKNIQLFYENELLITEMNLDFTYVLKGIKQLGNNSLKVTATKTDGVSNTRYKTFPVLSDFQPITNSIKVVNQYPHSTTFFTEGLLMHDGFLYESTGQNGTSGIHKVNLNTGKTIQLNMLDKKYFGEGITILDDKIFQLTYKSKKGFVYKLNDFALIDSFQINSAEGWGLTNDGSNLIMSDGSNILTWIDPNNYSIIKTVYVADNKSHIKGINELEYINGSVFANVWTKNFIIEIDPETGKILSQTDLSELYGLFNTTNKEIDVLNGIAYLKSKNNILVTGKFWPKLFEVKLKKSE